MGNNFISGLLLITIFQTGFLWGAIIHDSFNHKDWYANLLGLFCMLGLIQIGLLIGATV